MIARIIESKFQIIQKENNRDAMWQESLVFDRKSYSFDWFRCLGKMEAINNNSNKKHQTRMPKVDIVAWNLYFVDYFQIVF